MPRITIWKSIWQRTPEIWQRHIHDYKLEERRVIIRRQFLNQPFQALLRIANCLAIISRTVQTLTKIDLERPPRTHSHTLDWPIDW